MLYLSGSRLTAGVKEMPDRSGEAVEAHDDENIAGGRISATSKAYTDRLAKMEMMAPNGRKIVEG